MIVFEIERCANDCNAAMHDAGYTNDVEIEKMFSSFDVNHDNTISLEEKQAALQSLGIRGE